MKLNNINLDKAGAFAEEVKKEQEQSNKGRRKSA